MSSVNGDKSRYNRERKQKIAKRERYRHLIDTAAAKAKAPAPVKKAKTEPVSA
jgi:hypothetical protein